MLPVNKVFSYIYRNFLHFPLCPFLLVLVTGHHWEESSSVVFTPPHWVFIHINKMSAFFLGTLLDHVQLFVHQDPPGPSLQSYLLEQPACNWGGTVVDLGGGDPWKPSSRCSRHLQSVRMPTTRRADRSLCLHGQATRRRAEHIQKLSVFIITAIHSIGYVNIFTNTGCSCLASWELRQKEMERLDICWCGFTSVAIRI